MIHSPLPRDGNCGMVGDLEVRHSLDSSQVDATSHCLKLVTCRFRASVSPSIRWGGGRIGLASLCG